MEEHDRCQVELEHETLVVHDLQLELDHCRALIKEKTTSCQSLTRRLEQMQGIKSKL